jgi:hypothetical protein
VKAAAGALALAVILAAPASAQVAPPTAAPKAAGTPAKPKSARPPLNFSGVWVLDAAASRGAPSHMAGAVLSVRQDGNKISIEPIDEKRPLLLAEQIVADGRPYEKAVGAKQKGTVTAGWGEDGRFLWLEVIAGTPEEPVGAQRTIWRLADGGKTWTRQTTTIQAKGSKETLLVFRKRDAAKK